MKQAMLRSEGALLYSDLLALHRSLQVFLGNCDQLLGFMSSHLPARRPGRRTSPRTGCGSGADRS
jgi:hypothetical protein